MDEETPIQRAQRILSESIAFRTALLTDLHNEIELLCTDGWGKHHPRHCSSASRTSEKRLKFIDGTCAELGAGKRRYIVSAKK